MSFSNAGAYSVISGLDSINGRARKYVSAEQIIDAQPDPLKPGAREWVLPFDVIVDGKEVNLGRASCLVDAQGRPESDPELLLFKTTRADGKDVRVSIGDPAHPASLTDLAIKTTIKRFRETFGHEPDRLPGSLAEDNRAIFQRAYAIEILKGSDPKTAEERAIMATPFGRKRFDNGYTNLKVIPTGEIEILVGHPPQLVTVPKHIEVRVSK